MRTIQGQLFLLALLALIATSSHAQQPDNASADVEARAEEPTFTPFYAFANYFSSGLYQGTGGQLTVFNIPIKVEPDQEGRNKYRLRLPISLGFTDFQFDADGVSIPDTVATATVTAGIEFDHWVSDKLMLRPFLDVGYSQNFSGQSSSLIYAGGMSTFYYFQAAEEKQVMVTRFQRASFRTQGTLIVDGFSSIDSGIDWTLPFRYEMFEKPMYMSVYGRVYWYFLDQTSAEVTNDFGSILDAQELGFTLGWVKPLDMLLFDLDRIGFGYRTGDGLTAWRLFFGFPLE
ncbi:Uncharacterised protein [BD1-7 clade bacterium]|uniref:Transporter n=1 Tax=BD1-7 clade bacterium TaxID=2029982 RepID=A0A5S9MRJ7_9GAMM|nr:Uncharacterised protein [BD1-7 clade bacterium]